MLKSWTFRKQLRLIALTAALAIGIALVSGAILVYLYDRTVAHVQQHDLPDLNIWSATLSDVADIHTELVSLVSSARQTNDEQAIYIKGKSLTSRIDALAAQIQDAFNVADADHLPDPGTVETLKNIKEALLGYRASSLTAIEMLTVNPTLSDRYLVKSALSLNQLNQKIATHFSAKHASIDDRLKERIEQNEHNALLLVVGVLLLSGVIFLLIFRLTRNITGNFSFIGSTLEQLGAGRIDIVIEQDADDSEFGRVVGGLAMFRETLSERNFAQLKMQAIFDSILEAVIVIDADGRIIQTNPVACEMFGYSSEELLCQNVKILMPEDHASQHDEYLARYLRTGEAHIIGNLRIVDGLQRNGTRFPIQLAVSQVRVGHDSYFVGVIVDISERIEQERVLRAAHDAALESSRLKSEFLANMSHEIRTPMNGIIGMTDLALDTRSEDERNEYMSIVKSSAESLLTVINDILDFSKIEAGKLSVENVNFDLHRTVHDALRTLSLRAQEKGLAIGCMIAADTPCLVSGDPGRLRQVLLNLLGNAIKFTQSGEIAVNLAVDARDQTNATIRISVRDTGIGIPADKLAHVFEAFSQADGSTTRKYGGTGLGLTISNRLVELMGGRLWVESTIGVGSTFHFTLKLDVLTEASPVATVPGAPTLPQAEQFLAVQPALDVLLVEDNPVNQTLALRLIEKWGHRVTLAENGQQAIDKIVAGTLFDIVLMDMQMPVMGGIEATQCIRQFEREHGLPQLRIVAMTANAMQGDREACLAAGMDNYLSKPIKATELSAILYAQSAEKTSDAPRIEFPPAFDYAAAVQGMDPEIIDIIGSAFLEHYKGELAALRQALDNGDAAATQRHAHGLKGTLAAFGAQPAERRAFEMETLSKSGDLVNSAALLEELESEVEKLAVVLFAQYT